MGITPSLISEYKLTGERLSKAKLVIIPSAEFLDDSSAVELYNASRRGVKILFTNTYHRSITMLYKNDFTITKVARSGILASDPKHRKITYEIIIRSNYNVKR